MIREEIILEHARDKDLLDIGCMGRTQKYKLWPQVKAMAGSTDDLRQGKPGGRVGSMQITGSCFCGEIAYAAELDEAAVAICHCRDCQVFSGSAFRTSGIVPPDRFRITQGTPKHFDKFAESGAVRRMLFCGECGTHLCSLPMEDEGAFVSIRVATSHDFDKLTPRAEVFCSSRVAWQPGLEGTVQFQKMFERDS